MKLFKVNNGFVINDQFVTYIEHSIRLVSIPSDVGNNELLIETDQFKLAIKSNSSYLIYGYVGEDIVSFSYDTNLRELSCAIGPKIYKTSVITRFQRWSDKYPGNHIRMYVESDTYDYTSIIQLDYVYYHGAKSAEYDLMSITILIPDNKFEEFVLYAINNGYKTAISRD